MEADIVGALEQLDKSYKSFEHKGNQMTKNDVRKVLLYGIRKGYTHTGQLTDEEVDNVIKQTIEQILSDRFFTANEMLDAAEYAYNFGINTKFPEHTFAQECVNNTKQWMIAKFKIKNIWTNK